MTSLTLVPAQETICYMCFRRFKKRAQTKINMSPQDELQAQIIFPLKPLEIALADSIKEFFLLIVIVMSTSCVVIFCFCLPWDSFF